MIRGTSKVKVQQYIDSVLSGTRVAGLKEKRAVERYLRDMERAERGDPSFPYRFDFALAERACSIVETLEHTDGAYAGQPFTLYPWQAFVIFNLFGWVSVSTGYRRFREAFVSLARGNGKTPFGAAIMLIVFAFDSPVEARAEVYTAAVKRDQARLSFDAARRFLERAQLDEAIEVLKSEITVRGTHSVFSPLSSDAKTADGLNIHGLLRDELHAWTHYQREYYEKLNTALGKRRQPLAVTITTAGSETSEIWQEQYAIAGEVLDPHSPLEIESLFAFICEIDDEDCELDEAVWPKANPMLEYGIVNIAHLRDMAAKAAIHPAIAHELKRYHCNKLAFSAAKTFTPTLWSKGDAKPDKIPHTIYGAADLGWKDDFAAVGYCAPLDWVSINGKSKRRYAVWVDVWIPRGTSRDLRSEPFNSWVRQGLVNVTESEWTDTAPIYASIERVKKRHRVKSFAYDPNNAREFALTIENQIGIRTFAFAQKPAKYNEPFREFKQALDEGRILHRGCPVLAWSAMNVVEVIDSQELVMPSKPRSRDKIDPFVAVLMAYSEALFGETAKRSKYETSDPILVGEAPSEIEGQEPVTVTTPGGPIRIGF